MTRNLFKTSISLAVALLAMGCGEATTAWGVGDARDSDTGSALDLGADDSIDAPTDAIAHDLDTTQDPPIDTARDAATDPEDAPSDFGADSSDAYLDDASEPLVCSVDGVLGECLPVAECTGDRAPTPGYCPGPADIQCCTEIGVVSCSVGGVAGECIPVSECTGGRIATPGYCPGPADIQCCTEPSGAACDPAAVPQPNAGLTEEPGSGGCPSGMTRVADFCIDRFEGALEEILADGSRVPWSPYYNPGSNRVRAVSLRGAVPQGYISGRQAEAACNEAGKRLCTDQEWLRACQGASGYDYPYGSTEIAGACNENRPVHPAIEYFGTSADWIWSELGHQCINQLDDSLATAGEYSLCVNPEGVYDLVGNLHEWTANTGGVFRGGFYVDTWRNGIACNYATTAHNREHWDYSTGFRCCADVE